ncbi:MAG: hypothetical protein J1F66_03720 [Clostridiales bacterium]|nr:hypothetical protein [Clostridiales bacterium]
MAVIITLILCLPLKSLGLADKVVLNERTVADLKLENATIGQLFPVFKSLFADNSHLVNNAPTNDDATATDAKFVASSVNQFGRIQYSSLIYKRAVFVEGKALTFTDKQLAVLLNKTVKQAPDDALLSTSAEVLEFLGSRAIKDILNCLETYDVTVEQAKLVSKGNNATFEVLLSLDISQFVEGVQIPLFGELQNRIYVTLNYTLGVSGAGKLLLSDGSLSVNGKNAATSRLVLDALLIALYNDKDGEPQTTQTFIDGIAAFAQVVFEHVGEIGRNALSKGMSGVDAGNSTITFLPHTSLIDFLS